MNSEAILRLIGTLYAQLLEAEKRADDAEAKLNGGPDPDLNDDYVWHADDWDPEKKAYVRDRHLMNKQR